MNAVFLSLAGKALNRLNALPTPQHARRLREDALVNCISNNTIEPICRPLEKPCLFNIEKDPCEQYNLAEM